MVRRAFILAAGLGTRLKPFSDRLPKPAWPLFDRPIALHLIDRLAGAGVAEFTINLHHLPDAMRRAIEGRLPGGARVEWSFEERILGTGGALAPWLDSLAEAPFFLANADTHRSFNPAEMARFHVERGAEVTLSLVPLPVGAKGPVEIDAEGRIVRFLGAVSPSGGVPVTSCGFTGVHIIGPGVTPEIALVAARREKFCINADVHTRRVGTGAAYFGYIPEDRRWSDLGTPRTYLEGHFAFLESGELPPGTKGEMVLTDRDTPEGGRIVAPSWLGAGASIGRGAVAGPCAVICRGAQLLPGARVERGVVWPGAGIAGTVSGIVADWGEAMDADGAVRSGR